jgi:hypothetical protein
VLPLALSTPFSKAPSYLILCLPHRLQASPHADTSRHFLICPGWTEVVDIRGRTSLDTLDNSGHVETSRGADNYRLSAHDASRGHSRFRLEGSLGQDLLPGRTTMLVHAPIDARGLSGHGEY